MLCVLGLVAARGLASHRGAWGREPGRVRRAPGDVDAVRGGARAAADLPGHVGAVGNEVDVLQCARLELRDGTAGPQVNDDADRGAVDPFEEALGAGFPGLELA